MVVNISGHIIEAHYATTNMRRQKKCLKILSLKASMVIRRQNTSDVIKVTKSHSDVIKNIKGDGGLWQNTSDVIKVTQSHSDVIKSNNGDGGKIQVTSSK